MSKQEMRAYAVRANDDGDEFTFLAATENLARDGLILEMAGLDTTAYMKNPIVLVNHAYNELPIGRTTKLEKTRAGLVATIKLDTAHDDRARLVSGKIRRGYLNAMSIGWRTLEQVKERVVRSEALDLSLVSVPGDADALAMARSAYQSLIFPTRQYSPEDMAALEVLHKALCGPETINEQEVARQVRAQIDARVAALVRGELAAWLQSR